MSNTIGLILGGITWWQDAIERINRSED